MHQIGKIYNRVMALDPSQNFISSQCLKNVRMELTKFCLHFDIDKIWIEIVLLQFVQI